MTPRRSSPAWQRGRSTRTRRERGQALVEFSLVALIFFAILFAMFDFGTMLYSRMTVMNAAREGARAVIPFASEEAGLAEGIVVGAQSATSAASNGLLREEDVTVVCLDPAGATKACTDAQPEDSVRVTGNYLYRPFFPLLVGRVQVDLNASVEMVLE